jgi:hypothetical protein
MRNPGSSNFGRVPDTLLRAGNMFMLSSSNESNEASACLIKAVCCFVISVGLYFFNQLRLQFTHEKKKIICTGNMDMDDAEMKFCINASIPFRKRPWHPSLKSNIPVWVYSGRVKQILPIRPSQFSRPLSYRLVALQIKVYSFI